MIYEVVPPLTFRFDVETEGQDLGCVMLYAWWKMHRNPCYWQTSVNEVWVELLCMAELGRRGGE